MDSYNFLESVTTSHLEELYESFRNKPESVEETWRKFFQGFDFALKNYDRKVQSSEIFDHEYKVLTLIDAYRTRGHFFTRTNPVRDRRQYFPTLDIENFGLTIDDLDKVYQSGKTIGLGEATLRDIIAHLQDTYCRSIGAEFKYMREPERIQWLQEKMESCKNSAQLSIETKLEILNSLKKAVGFETFIHKKFVGQKRFSLEGAESLIPALDALIHFGSKTGVEEFVIGMSHRGRLNVLTNIMQKPYEDIFCEFQGKEYGDEIAQGDVKYHLGYNKKILSRNKKQVTLNLVPNPSHLETVGAVVQGMAHAMLKQKYNFNYKKLTPVIIHGDAAVATQGIVYEIIQMSQLDGYKTGGTIHLVINNQVGFTTNYLEARSSTYCTDVAKVVKSPVFHVNGDDVEALVYTLKLAQEFRQRFHTDVFIDILCYRRFGHNEGDEPRFTQPVLYKAIEKHPNVRDIYSKDLVENGIISEQEVKKLEREFNEELDSKANQSGKKVEIIPFLPEVWSFYRRAVPSDFDTDARTAVKQGVLRELASKITALPEGKAFFNKLIKLVESRKEMISSNNLDWAMCEQLAYASLLNEGNPVRLSGQDSQRGTFSHRHAAMVVEDTTDRYFPLKNISPTQASFDVFNSPLSEYGVLGFEYGYSIMAPHGLTIWEAQFGDFFNVAQVIIDQYLSSAEEKWNLMSGLVLLLPHGFEGQGPEHSSARIERFLTLCAKNNMQVLNCSTPANFFHAMRRQVLTDYRKPLIVFTPKSLLRHPECVSTFEDLSDCNFKELIDDSSVDPTKVNRVLLCTGKVYYDLLAKKRELNNTDIAIVRIEQLYPFPTKKVEMLFEKYVNCTEWVWVQEEPGNMGAWNFIRGKFPQKQLMCVSRPENGSPATGLHEQHVRQQRKVVDKAFRLCKCERLQQYCLMHCDLELNW